MDAGEYQQLAARTMIDKLGFEIGDLDMMILWNALGLCGETAELLERAYSSAGFNSIEDYGELGDVAWYMAAICTNLDIDLGVIHAEVTSHHYGSRSILSLCLDLCVMAGKVAELVKKGILHQHGLDLVAVKAALRGVYMCILRLCGKLSVSVVFEANINKLKKRYPNGFDSADSIKRVDVQEVIPAQ